MKKIIIISALVVLLGSWLFWRFWWVEHQRDNFINIYKEILIVREMYPDTASANPHIRQVYAKNHITSHDFKQMYFEYAQQPEIFFSMIDSARERARRESKPRLAPAPNSAPAIQVPAVKPKNLLKSQN